MIREPYIITQNLSVQEITRLIQRAYDEGYTDGFGDGQKDSKEKVPEEWRISPEDVERWMKDSKELKIPMSPNVPISPTFPNAPTTPITPNDWPPTIITCNNNEVKT